MEPHGAPAGGTAGDPPQCLPEADVWPMWGLHRDPDSPSTAELLATTGVQHGGPPEAAESGGCDMQPVGLIWCHGQAVAICTLHPGSPQAHHGSGLPHNVDGHRHA